jgi:hypothetical protein
LHLLSGLENTPNNLPAISDLVTSGKVSDHHGDRAKIFFETSATRMPDDQYRRPYVRVPAIAPGIRIYLSIAISMLAQSFGRSARKPS